MVKGIETFKTYFKEYADNMSLLAEQPVISCLITAMHPSE